MPQGVDWIFLLLVAFKLAIPIGFLILVLALINWAIKPPTMR